MQVLRTRHELLTICSRTQTGRTPLTTAGDVGQHLEQSLSQSCASRTSVNRIELVYGGDVVVEPYPARTASSQAGPCGERASVWHASAQLPWPPELSTPRRHRATPLDHSRVAPVAGAAHPRPGSVDRSHSSLRPRRFTPVLRPLCRAVVGGQISRTHRRHALYP